MQYEYHTLHDYYTLYDQRQLVPGERFIRKRQAKIRQSVERSPEKAGGGGSIPSLATTFSTTYKSSKQRVGPNWSQNLNPSSLGLVTRAVHGSLLIARLEVSDRARRASVR